jgi:hypothetical protein
MNRMILQACLGLVFSLAAFSPASSAEPSKNVPAQRFFPKCALIKTPNTDDIVPGRVFAIGWSADGAFAYCVEQFWEAAGFTDIKLFIKNLKNDEVLDSLESYEEETIKDFWQKHGQPLDSVLSKWKIVPQKQCSIEKFPIVTGRDTVFIKVTSSIKDTADSIINHGLPILSPTTVIAKAASPRLGEKTIYKNVFPIGITMASAGYIRSPFEPRACVILKYEDAGQHGLPPNYIHFIFVGLHLEKGFTGK